MDQKPPQAEYALARPRDITSAVSLWTPTEKQWQEYKPIILHLYATCRNDLSNVIEDMRRKYGFNATMDQYKGHINRKWKVSGKYRTEDEMRAMAIIAALRAKSGEESHFRLRGKYVSPGYVRRYWKRKDMTVKQAASTTNWVTYPPGLECIPAATISTSLTAPKDFSEPEKIFWHMRKFACNWNEFQYSLFDTGQFLARLLCKFDNKKIGNPPRRPGKVRCQRTATRFNYVLWIVAFMLGVRDGRPKDRIISDILEPVARVTPDINESARTIFHGMINLPRSSLNNVASLAMGVCLQSLTEKYSPTHEGIFGLAIDYAFMTKDFPKLRRILEDFTAYLTSNHPSQTTSQLLRVFEGWSHLRDSWQVHELGTLLLRNDHYHNLSGPGRAAIFRGLSRTSRSVLSEHHFPAERHALQTLLFCSCYKYDVFSLQAREAWSVIVTAYQIAFEARNLKAPALPTEEPDDIEFDEDHNALRVAWLALEDKRVDDDGSLLLSPETREKFDELKRSFQQDDPDATSRLALCSL